MLIPLPSVKNLEIFFWGKVDPFVNYVVKTKPNRYRDTHPTLEKNLLA